jgi:integral membrane sensor domain MASE1
MFSPTMQTCIVRNALTAAVYLLVGKAALSLALLHPSVTPVWPSTGIAMAACLLSTSRVWPAVLVSAFVVNQTTMGSVLTSAAIAVGNTLEALLGAYLVQRFAGGPKAFWAAEGVLTFAVLGALLSTTVSATIGVGSFTLTGAPPGATWASCG